MHIQWIFKLKKKTFNDGFRFSVLPNESELIKQPAFYGTRCEFCKCEILISLWPTSTRHTNRRQIPAPGVSGFWGNGVAHRCEDSAIQIGPNEKQPVRFISDIEWREWNDKPQVGFNSSLKLSTTQFTFVQDSIGWLVIHFIISLKFELVRKGRIYMYWILPWWMANLSSHRINQMQYRNRNVNFRYCPITCGNHPDIYIYIEIVRRYCLSCRQTHSHGHRFENLYQLIHVICTNSFCTHYKSTPFYSCLFECTSVLCYFGIPKAWNCFPLKTWMCGPIGSCSCDAHINLVIDLQCRNGHRPMAALSDRFSDPFMWSGRPLRTSNTRKLFANMVFPYKQTQFRGKFKWIFRHRQISPPNQNI